VTGTKCNNVADTSGSRMLTIKGTNAAIATDIRNIDTMCISDFINLIIGDFTQQIKSMTGFIRVKR
jgi:hypothetical protein